MHLQPDELIDLAEGTRAESSAPHLITCAVCRAELDDVKAVMTSAARVDVPEPSPLFWAHLSRRVGEAVAAEGSPRSAWWSTIVGDGPAVRVRPRGFRPRLFAAVAFAAIVLAVVFSARDRFAVRESIVATTAVTGESMPEPQAGDDPSLVLVAELTSEMDLDGVAEAGLTPQGSAEHAVTHMDGGELRELQKLLQVELASVGA